MKRESYDKVQRWMADHPGKTVAEACRETDVRPGAYYREAKALPKRKKKRVRVTHEVVALTESAATTASSPIRPQPGVVALMGTPEDIASMMAMLARGGGR